MALTIYRTLMQENLMQDTADRALLKSIIEKHTWNRDPFEVDAPAIFDEITSLEGWCSPSEGNEETALDWYDPAWEVTLRDGTKAGLSIQTRDNIEQVNIFAL